MEEPASLAAAQRSCAGVVARRKCTSACEKGAIYKAAVCGAKRLKKKKKNLSGSYRT